MFESLFTSQVKLKEIKEREKKRIHFPLVCKKSEKGYFAFLILLSKLIHLKTF